MKYTIFCEGKDDLSFIEDYLKHLFKQEYNKLNIEFVSTGGWTKIPDSLPKFQETSDVGGKNIVVFDADFAHTYGGFEIRRRALNELKGGLGIEFELFLFPNNHSDGIFENLLEDIVCENHRCIIDCFNSYEECIQLHNQDNSYNAPVQKSRIYAYIETVANPKEFEHSRKKSNLCYGNTDYWNLDSDRIGALRNFFLYNFTERNQDEADNN